MRSSTQKTATFAQSIGGRDQRGEEHLGRGAAGTAIENDRARAIARRDDSSTSRGEARR